MKKWVDNLILALIASLYKKMEKYLSYSDKLEWDQMAREMGPEFIEKLEKKGYVLCNMNN